MAHPGEAGLLGVDVPAGAVGIGRGEVVDRGLRDPFVVIDAVGEHGCGECGVPVCGHVGVAQDTTRPADRGGQLAGCSRWDVLGVGWQQVLTNRYDHLLAGAGHYSEDDAGEEAAQVIPAWWAAARA